MASTNPFDLLGDDDNDDPSLLLAAQQQKVAAVAAATKKSVPAAAGQGAKPAKFPTKPLPPTQAVKEARNEGGRGGGRGGGGRGYGRGRGGAGGFNRDSEETTFGNGNGLPYKPSEDREAGRYNSERRPYTRGGSRGGRRGGFNDGEGGEGERPRRTYDRHSGSGHGSEFKRDGAGRGNWGTPTDVIPQETDEPVAESEPNTAAEKQQNEEESSDVIKEKTVEDEEREAEEKQMTLEEYEKVLEEKRKALLNMKVEERKVDTTEFESMQVVSKKKDNNEIFAKLGSDKDKRKEAADKEERAKKSVSINEFLKPAEGESFYRSGGRGRGRGRGGPRGGGYGGGGRGYDAPAPSIADPGHFPSLGGK